MITDYATLQTALADLLGRTDLTAAIPGFIQDVESRLRRDERARRLTSRGTFNIAADGEALPTDLFEIESWYHNGPTYYGPIHVTTSDGLSELKLRHGITGPPAYAAIVDGRARFAPVPDATYPTQMTYWRKLTPLSASSTTNWLLLDSPDIYKYGAAMFAAPYLQEDPRLAVWERLYETALNELDHAAQRARFGGALRRNVTPIGG
jgi:hypothetical protein